MGVCLLLVLLTAAIYGRVYRFEFVNYDDGRYVTENAFVMRPFTADSLRWAFTTGYFANWHPVTWLSHMLDYRLFGTNPAGHHVVNVLIHALNAILLFEVLRRASARVGGKTRAFWCSALIALLFAVHPLRVESVAWVSERKDVLSACFGLLALLAYVDYTKRPAIGRYLLIVPPFALGLMSKSMLVTLPVLLLLLDYWPLRRFECEGASSGTALRRWFWLGVEKVPLFALSLGTVLIAIQLKSPQTASAQARAGQALLATAGYIWKTLWPSRLAAFYPHRGASVTWSFALLLCAVLGAISIVAFCNWRKRPYLTMGWLWYLGALAPASGIVQIGDHGMADRYTYLPTVGLYVMLAWSLGDWARGSRARARAGGAVASAVLVAFSVVAWRQAGYWRDSETLWRRAVAATEDNEMAHVKLGTALMARGAYAEAAAQFEEALRIRPDSDRAVNNLASLRLSEGRPGEALTFATRALAMNPDNPLAHINAGIALASLERMDEAMAHFTEALKLEPGNQDAHFNLATAFYLRREYENAATHFGETVRADPFDVRAHFGLGVCLFSLARFDEARDAFERVLRLQPNHAEAKDYLARMPQAAGS
ncbi:MAG: tetratricopeptide repeat protein [Nitrospiraceae bacterium]|nr:tetratricopeptide repeat protein [Nitrospiraceae bacterium]